MPDLEKRKRVMARSARLGHCICQPKQPCPCDTLREKDVCPCAGESLPRDNAPVRLTELVASPGCASKIDQAALRRILAGLPEIDDPRVLVGMPAGDDAGVYQIDDQTALVQTVDVFSPCVDDPYTFGQIAAANSLSDVYAMGGRPLSALSIVGFPLGVLPDDVLRQILRGGVDKMNEAGVPVLGGHSINDPQIKAGFAVTGLVHPSRVMTNARLSPGHRLVLTKPLGTGIVAFAAQIGRAPPGAVEAAARWMSTLNRRAAELMLDAGAQAATDVTGFGLAGHLGAMAASSRVDVEVLVDALPLLPGVRQCAAAGIASGAVERNRESSGPAVVADPDVDPAMLDICFDPQTSGGLLIALDPQAAETLVARLHDEGMTEAAIIGQAIGPGEGRIHVRAGRHISTSTTRNSCPVRPLQTAKPAACCATRKETAVDCCGEGARSGSAPGGAKEIQQRFQDFLKAAAKPGALDAATKQAIAIALSTLARCEPCLEHHVRKAREMGFSQDEIDEAAWMAIGFGGSPTMMLYNKLRHTGETAPQE